MEKQNLVENYEKEFAIEIAKEDISIDDLKKCGVSEKVFVIENYLRGFYGDKIDKQVIVDDLDSDAQKKVTKIGDMEKEYDNQLKEIFEEIENSEFDKNLDVITH